MKKAYWYMLRWLTRLSPKASTSLRYLMSKRRRIDWEHPKSLDEKISWLKVNVYNHSPLVAQCADKYRVREYVKELGISEILNELYETYDSLDDVRWHELPETFALKWSSGSGGNVICKDRSKFDHEIARSHLKRTQSGRSHIASAELQYSRNKNVLLCERYIDPGAKDQLLDYKFYCYEGVPKYILVIRGRSSGSLDYYVYDTNWTRVYGLLKNEGREPGLEKPAGLEDATRYAAKLSKPFPFVRTDLYIVDGKTIFGELTFTPAGGVSASMSNFGDRELGDPLRWLFEETV